MRQGTGVLPQCPCSKTYVATKVRCWVSVGKITFQSVEDEVEDDVDDDVEDDVEESVEDDVLLESYVRFAAMASLKDFAADCLP